MAQKWIETKKDVEEKKTQNKRLVNNIRKDKKERFRKSGREKKWKRETGKEIVIKGKPQTAVSSSTTHLEYRA